MTLPGPAQFENIGGLKEGAGLHGGRQDRRVRPLASTWTCSGGRHDAHRWHYDRSRPTATPASSAGLLGGGIGISPGGSEEYLHDGDQIEFVQDAIVLENLISKYLFSQAGKDSKSETPAPQE
jgi:phospholipid/cholesterol/gamma-HCH transport system substrate-binding protein